MCRRCMFANVISNRTQIAYCGSFFLASSINRSACNLDNGFLASLEMTKGVCDSDAAAYNIRRNASSANGFLASSK